MSAPRIRLCHVCGCSEDEVVKLHYFPVRLERSKIWQQNMGMCYTGETLQNYRICSRHFTIENYVDRINHRLSRTAVPTLFPCQRSTCQGQVNDFVKIGDGNLDASSTSKMIPGDLTTKLPRTGGEVLEEITVTPMSQQTPIIQKRSVFRGIDNLSKITATPRKRKLMDMVVRKEDHIRKLKRLCKQRAHDIKSLSELDNSPVVKQIFHGMPTSTANFLLSQLRCAKRHPKGRRWTVEEKIVALALLKRSPKCYKLLSQIVAMPSKRTLLSLLNKVPFHVGINEHLFRHISYSVTSVLDELCVLLFDEMDIKENLQYDITSDRIIGFEDLGDHSGTEIANRALVFMCQGLSRPWKQPVAYYFSKNGCSATNLIFCIKQVLHAARNVGGLDVVGTICDMGTTNVKALKSVGVSVDHPYFNFEEKEIYTMFDPPHLLKCLVSLFRKHNVVLPVTIDGNQETPMEARFSDVRAAYEVDKKTPLIFRAMPKLKEYFMAPIMRFAMKVNVAAQTMSRTVASFIYTLLSRGELEPRAIATATFIQQVDELFDSFNGNQRNAPDGKPLKCSITDRSPHTNYWDRASVMVNSWKFQRKTKNGNLRTSKPPSQSGWLVSLKAIQFIWNYVKQKGLPYLRGRTLNQDSLENLFGNIRGGCGYSDNPTAAQFVASLKTQILNGLTKQNLTGSNCEQDEHHLLTNLKEFITMDEEPRAPSIADLQEFGVAPLEPDSHLPANKRLVDDIADAVAQGNTCTLSVAYVSGFIVKSILRKVNNCAACSNSLCSLPTDPHNLFIMNKEWTDDKLKLFYPSEAMVVCVGSAVTLLEQFLPVYGGKAEVGKSAGAYLKARIDFSPFGCIDHGEIVHKEILQGVIRIGIPWWCKRRNESQKQAKKAVRKAIKSKQPLKKVARETTRKLKILAHN